MDGGVGGEAGGCWRGRCRLRRHGVRRKGGAAVAVERKRVLRNVGAMSGGG